MSPEEKIRIRAALERSWSGRTSLCFDPEHAPLSYGQCAATAIVIQEHFGGEILRTDVPKLAGGSSRHFYNRISGQRVDFTADQFDIPNYWCALAYSDNPSSADEALTELLHGQIDAMRKAFAAALAESE